MSEKKGLVMLEDLSKSDCVFVPKHKAEMLDDMNKFLAFAESVPVITLDIKESDDE